MKDFHLYGDPPAREDDVGRGPRRGTLQGQGVRFTYQELGFEDKWVKGGIGAVWGGLESTWDVTQSFSINIGDQR